MMNTITRDCISCSKNKSSRGYVKCCDYFPFIPNFLVGFGLKDNNILWKELFQNPEIIKQPLGLIATKALKEKLKSKNDSSHCYFYQIKSGQCKIWDHRPKVCETYFCDLNLKEKSISKHLTKSIDTEMQQAQLLLLEMGLISPEIQLCLSDYNKSTESNETINLFQSLSKTPEEFYVNCHVKNEAM
jgi:Fe-S-cluster containining protein